MIRELAYPHNLQERALLAATKAGHASAMIANLHLGGTLERIPLWEEELAVWQSRREEIIGRMSIKSTVIILAEEAFRDAQTSKMVPAHEFKAPTAEV